MDKKRNELILQELAEEAGINLPAEKMSIMATFLARSQYGHQLAMPMRCKGNKCPLIEQCPIKQAGEDLPIGKRCPVEGTLMQMWVERTCTSMEIDPLDPHSSVDIDMVYELASLEIMRNRAAAKLSENPEVYEEKIVGYSNQGDAVRDYKINPGIEIMERLGKRIDKIREQLLATKKSQAQVGVVSGDDSSKAAAAVEKARKIAEARQNKFKKEKDARDAEYDIKAEDNPPLP